MSQNFFPFCFCFLTFYPRQCQWRVHIPHWNFTNESKFFPLFSSSFWPSKPGNVHRGSWSHTEISEKWVRIFPPFSSAFLPFTLGSVYRGSSSDTEISVKKSWTFFPFFLQVHNKIQITKLRLGFQKNPEIYTGLVCRALWKQRIVVG